MEAAYTSTDGPSRERRTRELIEAALSASACAANPKALGLSLAMAAGCAWSMGRWAQSREHAERAIALLGDRCSGVTWERDTAHIFNVDAMRWMGAWREMQRQL